MSTPVLREQVRDAVRTRIISGEIPPGGSLVEQRLAAELQVSRTPLREAIRQLVEEGFLEQEARRGARVVAFTAELVREVYQVREALEGIAAREAAARMDVARIRQLREYLETLRPRIEQGDFSDTGDSIHEAIFEACGNSQLEKLMSVYRGKVMWIQQTSFRISHRLDKAFQEHESIVRALECRDADWAETAARRHIRNTVAELMELLGPRTRTRGLPGGAPVRKRSLAGG